MVWYICTYIPRKCQLKYTKVTNERISLAEATKSFTIFLYKASISITWWTGIIKLLGELSNYLYKEKTSLPHQENWNQVKIALCKFPTVIFVWNFSANVVKEIWDLIRVVYTLYHLVHFHKIWSPFFCWDEWIIGLLLFLLLLILVMDSISF